jgi:multiple sugar transport system permease protein
MTTETIPRRLAADPAPAPPARRHTSARTVLSQVLLTAVLLLFLMPFVWMIATALKPPAEVFGAGNGLIGSEIRWSNFSEAWGYLPFGRFMLNGLYVALVGTVVVCVTSVLSAYAFARLRSTWAR